MLVRGGDEQTNGGLAHLLVRVREHDGDAADRSFTVRVEDGQPDDGRVS